MISMFAMHGGVYGVWQLKSKDGQALFEILETINGQYVLYSLTGNSDSLTDLVGTFPKLETAVLIAADTRRRLFPGI